MAARCGADKALVG